MMKSLLGDRSHDEVAATEVVVRRMGADDEAAAR